MVSLIIIAYAFSAPMSYDPAYNKTGLFVNQSSEYIAPINYYPVDRVLISAPIAPGTNDGTDDVPKKKPVNIKGDKPPETRCTGSDDIKDCNK